MAAVQTQAQPIPANGFEYSAEFTLPPMSVVYYQVEKPKKQSGAKRKKREKCEDCGAND